MNKQSQVCTYEQAVKLKEMGFPQNGVFCYNHPQESYIPNWKGNGYNIVLGSGDNYGVYTRYDYFSAYTTAELFELLPNDKWAVPYRYGLLDIKSDVFTESYIELRKTITGYITSISSIDNISLFSISRFESAHSLADMLIQITEHGLYSAEQVGK